MSLRSSKRKKCKFILRPFFFAFSSRILLELSLFRYYILSIVFFFLCIKYIFVFFSVLLYDFFLALILLRFHRIINQDLSSKIKAKSKKKNPNNATIFIFDKNIRQTYYTGENGKKITCKRSEPKTKSNKKKKIQTNERWARMNK